MIMTKSRVALVFIILTGITAVGCGDGMRAWWGAPHPFNVEEAHEAVESLAQELEEKFVYPEIGADYARTLRARKSAGAYDDFETAADFAKAVTKDLQEVQPEGHLRVIPPGETLDTGPFADIPNLGKGVVKSGWIAPGVGYMSLHGFQGNQEQYTGLLNHLRTVLDTLSDAGTLIVDARWYVGGALMEADLMASYLFPERTTLLVFDTRRSVEEAGGGIMEESEHLKRVESPEGFIRRRQIAIPVEKDIALKSAKILVLTSEHTASGGEAFTLSLKRTDRAILIGETTAGAGHFGPTASLGGGYRAFISIGRTLDPTTGKGWELTGVEPDVKVAAENALDEALKRAGVNPVEGRKAIDTMEQ